MLPRRMKCRVEESRPVSVALNLEYNGQPGRNIYLVIHIWSRLNPSNKITLTLRAQEVPKVGTMSTTGIGPRKNQKHSPLFDPTAEKVMESNWELRGSQSATFPSIIMSESRTLILWFPIIFLPLVSSFFFWEKFFETGILQISRPIRMITKDDWHSLVYKLSVSILFPRYCLKDHNTLHSATESKDKYTFPKPSTYSRLPLSFRLWSGDAKCTIVLVFYSLRSSCTSWHHN